jgi:hypothetical protein
MKKILNAGNKIHNIISSSGSDFLTSYGSGSGSTSQKVTDPTVPVPQRCVAPMFGSGSRKCWNPNPQHGWEAKVEKIDSKSQL